MVTARSPDVTMKKMTSDKTKIMFWVIYNFYDLNFSRVIMHVLVIQKISDFSRLPIDFGASEINQA